jgi:hypothetical protein
MYQNITHSTHNSLMFTIQGFFSGFCKKGPCSNWNFYMRYTRAFSASLIGPKFGPITMSDRDHFSQFQEKYSQFQEKNPISTEIPFAYNTETNKQETI